MASLHLRTHSRVVSRLSRPASSSAFREGLITVPDSQHAFFKGSLQPAKCSQTAFKTKSLSTSSSFLKTNSQALLESKIRSRLKESRHLLNKGLQNDLVFAKSIIHATLHKSTRFIEIHSDCAAADADRIAVVNA